MSEVQAILANYHALKERQYLGDVCATDILMDFHEALTLANLTDRQSESLSLLFGDDLTHSSASKTLGISGQAISYSAKSAIDKIQSIYDKWEAKAL